MAIFGVGTELVECLRIAQMIERHGDLFINRVYTPAEIEYCQQQRSLTEHYTGIWAAKKAILKAVGVTWGKGVGWTHLEIRHKPGTAPSVAFRGGIRDIMKERGVQEIFLSISQCRMYALATAIAEK